MISGIYTITNEEDGKMYIGQSLDIPRRWKDHVDDLFEGKHHNPHLQNAFNKYGYTSFHFQIFIKCEPKMLDIWEQLSILSAIDDGFELYNIKEGGTESPMTNEHKKNIGIANKGKVRSEATKAKLSVAVKAYYENHENPFKGKKHDEETRKRMSLAKQGKPWTLAQYEARGL